MSDPYIIADMIREMNEQEEQEEAQLFAASRVMLNALLIAEEQYENFAGAGKDDGTLAVIRSAIAFAKSNTKEKL
jgi:hypothetical protein